MSITRLFVVRLRDELAAILRPLPGQTSDVTRLFPLLMKLRLINGIYLYLKKTHKHTHTHSTHYFPKVKWGKCPLFLIVSFMFMRAPLASSREIRRDRPSSRPVSWRRCSRATRCADSSRPRTFPGPGFRASRPRGMETTWLLPTPLDPSRSTRYCLPARRTCETRVGVVGSPATHNCCPQLSSDALSCQERQHSVAVTHNFCVLYIY